MSTPRRSESKAVRVAVLASGAGSTFDALLQARHAGALDVEISLLVASRDEADAITVARSRCIAHVTLDEKHLGHDAVDEAMLTALSAHRIDLIVLAGYTRKVGRRTLAAYSRRIINTHPAPLPRFGGKRMYGEHVHRAVLESGVTESAATVHLVDAEYDTGPVIAVRSVAVKPDDDVGALRARVQIAERALLIQTLNQWARGTSNHLPRFSGGGASGAGRRRLHAAGEDEDVPDVWNFGDAIDGPRTAATASTRWRSCARLRGSTAARTSSTPVHLLNPRSDVDYTLRRSRALRVPGAVTDRVR